MTRNYTITNWKGFENFECELCPYAILSAEKIEDHLITHHQQFMSPVYKPDTPPPKRTPGIKLVKKAEPKKGKVKDAKN